MKIHTKKIVGPGTCGVTCWIHAQRRVSKVEERRSEIQRSFVRTLLLFGFLVMQQRSEDATIRGHLLASSALSRSPSTAFLYYKPGPRYTRRVRGARSRGSVDRIYKWAPLIARSEFRPYYLRNQLCF